jgi:Putative adhesin
MKLMLRIAMLSCAGVIALGATSCKVTECTESGPDGGTVKKENCLQLQPTVEYRDARVRSGDKPWTSGRSVSITNENGPLKVALGNAGDQRVAFAGTAFTRETNNAEGAQKAKDQLGKMADPAFAADNFISLVAPGGGYDGYDLTVWLPPDFDAALTITNKNGTTTVYGANGTTETVVNSHAIVATNLRGTIKLTSAVGDIDARGTPSGKGNIIRAELGDVNTSLGAVNLAVTATSKSGMVIFPTEWPQNVAADKMSGSATLGDGTGDLTVSTGNGNLTFFPLQ